MDKLLEEYENKFGEEFPMMLCRGMDDINIKVTIEQCIANNKPYEVGNGDY